MASPSLIAARPWTNAAAIDGLFSAATAARVGTGAGLVRVIPEQLARGAGAGRRQAVRVEAGADVALTRLAVEIDGRPVDVQRENGPRGSHRLLVPAVDAEVDAAIVLDATRLAFRLRPVRDWSIHLIHHSHLDIGYTDPQGVVLEHQRSFLDSALELLRATADWPEESRFRWVVESYFTFEQWAARRPPAQVDEMVGYLRDGRAELTALPFNMHSDTCSTDELHELLSGAKRIADRYGIAFDSAMQTDVPGTVVGLPEALADFDVKYLAVAHNWAGRSMPQLHGGQLLPRLFRWAAPSGKSVLVWLTDSPHGMAYMEGPLLGFHEGYAAVADNLPVYLASLATNPYPFPPGVFGWHGTAAAVDREPYPWDIVHLRTQGWVGDNAPARLQASKIVREWNETWSSPRLRMSTNSEFFTAAEQRLGSELRTFEGDWGDWWVEGVGSAAYPQALVRDAQFRVTEAGALAALHREIAGTPVPGLQDEVDTVYRTISLFNEHTWGAANSWLTTDSGFDSGATQWQWKVSQGIRAHEYARASRERASAYLGSVLGASPDAVASFYVVNVEGAARSGAVSFLVRESSVPLDASFVVRDARTGARLPHRVESQRHREHRESGRWVSVRVDDVPSVGFVRLDLVADDAAAPASLGEVTDPLVLTNDHLTVRVDLARAGIVSVLDRRTGRELLNPASLFVGNEYIYDTYTTAPGFNHHSNRSSSTADLELLGSRSRARSAAFVERVDDALEQRLVYELAGDGVDFIRVTLRLGRGGDVLCVENRVIKPSTRVKESGYFVFPFAGSRPAVRFEVTGGIAGDGLEHVPGAPQHMRGVRTWASVTAEDAAAVWVTRDAPLAQRGSIALPYAPFPASTAPDEPGTIISWFHNNVWDTNFPVEQAFDTVFAYAIGAPRPDESVTAAAVRAAAGVTNPLIAVHATARGDAPALDATSMLSLDRADVRVVSMTPRTAGEVLVRLQSFADDAVEVVARTSDAVATAASATFLGREIAAAHFHEGAVRIDIPRLGTAGLLLRSHP